MFKLFGQSRPTTTTNTLIYTVPVGFDAIISSIIICNTSGASADATVFVSNSGGAFGHDHAILHEVPVANATFPTIVDCKIVVNSGGTVGVKTSSANDLTFTISGMEHANS
jgi:hypothetical protein